MTTSSLQIRDETPMERRSLAPGPPPSRWGTIERVDIREHRDEVTALFTRSGKTDFPRQFDWYYRQVGQSMPTSWILRDNARKICGVCSVTERPLTFGTTRLRAGVAGNLLVDRHAADYLAAFRLVRAMKSLVTNHEIDLLLGIPNELAQPVFSRAGFHWIDRWDTYVQVFRSHSLLRARAGVTASLASPFVDLGAAVRRGMSHWSQSAFPGFLMVDVTEDELNHISPQEWPSPDSFAVSSSPSYLAWRFLHDPAKPAAIAAFVAPAGDICGYLAFRREPGRIWIIDCRVNHGEWSEADAILCFCRQRQHWSESVWVTSLHSGSLSQRLASSGFVRVPHAVGGYPDYPLIGFWLPTHPLAHAFAQASSWNLFPGFNDV